MPCEGDAADVRRIARGTRGRKWRNHDNRIDCVFLPTKGMRNWIVIDHSPVETWTKAVDFGGDKESRKRRRRYGGAACSGERRLVVEVLISKCAEDLVARRVGAAPSDADGFPARSRDHGAEIDRAALLCRNRARPYDVLRDRFKSACGRQPFRAQKGQRVDSDEARPGRPLTP